jgi:hypothetical protein
MQIVLTIIGIIGLLTLIVLFIKSKNMYEAKELSLEKEIDSLKEAKPNSVKPTTPVAAVVAPAAPPVAVAPVQAPAAVVNPPVATPAKAPEEVVAPR